MFLFLDIFIFYGICILGGVYYINDAGTLVEVFRADGPVYKLLYYDEKNILVTVTSNMMLSQHAVTNDGETRELLKVCQLFFRNQYC